MGSYEQQVRSALLLAGILAAASLVVTLLLLACYAIESPPIPKRFFVLGVVTAAIFAVVAQDRYNRFKVLLVPNTFSTEEFNNILTKYRKYQSIGGWFLLVLAIIGIFIGALGSIT
ncbi:hypothetical protein [Xanthomonas translucens]|uniref:hypothetical protein n=1 Tax=Xanthomonas campestris pv. translucens TaxID=343 RepID=UPI0009C10C56|nr:hypothetical protein [Xanthomonas translucens]UJB15426.1 hypothetical protein LTC53_01565 [Xanthomonas translucens pv. undulosa]